MRVVHVSDCFPPRVGGIETQVHDLAARQAAAGHEVHVLTATRGADGAYRAVRVLPSGVRVHRMASPLGLGLPVNPRGPWLVRAALRRLRPDVVHVHAGVVSPFAYDGARVARSLGLPLALTWHCMLDGVEGPLGAAARLTGWDTAPVALSAVSAVAGARVARVMRRPEVGVLPNGLDVAAWTPRAGRRPLPPEGPLRVVATQRLAPRKRALPLVRAVARAHRRLGEAAGPRIHLTLIGSGPDLRAVQAEVARQQLQEVVEVAGRVPRESLAARYAGEHVFAAPAHLEAFGIAALEARAAGLVVVADRDTGISEFVTDGVDGLLGAGDDALTDALVRLAGDGPLLRRLRAHARAVPPAADWSDVLRAADTLYARAIALRAPGGQRPRGGR